MIIENISNDLILGTFVDISTQNQPFTHILQLFRKPLSNTIISTKSEYPLPIGKFYDVFSGELFCGTLFEFSNRYKIKLDYNNFSVYSKYKEYFGVRACSKNDRWSCFADNTDSAIIVVSNMCFNLDIRK